MRPPLSLPAVSSSSRGSTLTRRARRRAVVVAFREFSVITDDTIASERKRFRSEVLVSIETFAKRTAIRNLSSTGRLDKAQLGLAYDHFQLAVLRMKDAEREAAIAAARTTSRSRASSVNTLNAPSPTSLSSRTSDPSLLTLDADGRPPREDPRPEDRIDRRAFGGFMGDVATWARDEKVVRNGLIAHVERVPVEHVVIDRVFAKWDVEGKGALSFQVRGPSSRSLRGCSLSRARR